MRVLIIGDSPHINTGFGTVNLIAAKAFQSQGWAVASVAGLADNLPEDDKGIKTYPADTKGGDPLGLRQIPVAIAEFEPDIIYMTADTGSLGIFTQFLPDMPVFVYHPIEGAPIVNIHWKRISAGMQYLACSKYGSDLVKEQFGITRDWVYHGVDHSVFKVTGNRDETRKAMGWQDKFVISCVATNVRRKQLPRLIEAFSILRTKYKQLDAVLYMHTIPFNNHWLEGWNLKDVTDLFGVSDHVYFSKTLQDKRPLPQPALAELYNASDLFVLPSQVEGFGLPIAEAMACGVPVLVTKYAAGWEVASPAGRGIPVHDWEVHKSGTLYANVSPVTLAEEILRLKRNPKDRQRMSEAGLRRAQDFQWSAFTDKLIPAMEQAVVTYQERNPVKEEQDTPEEDGAQVNNLRQEQVGHQVQEDSVLPEGQGEDSIHQEAQDGPVAAQEA